MIRMPSMSITLMMTPFRIQKVTKLIRPARPSPARAPPPKQAEIGRELSWQAKEMADVRRKLRADTSAAVLQLPSPRRLRLDLHSEPYVEGALIRLVGSSAWQINDSAIRTGKK